MNFFLEGLTLTIPVVLALVGWFVVHGLNSRRDSANQRRQLKTQYLIEAFRRVEAAAHRNNKLPEDVRGFESAMADIQLFGSDKQIRLAHDFMTGMAAASSSANVDGLLEELRQDLREELNLESTNRRIAVFRISDT